MPRSLLPARPLMERSARIDTDDDRLEALSTSLVGQQIGGWSCLSRERQDSVMMSQVTVQVFVFSVGSNPERWQSPLARQHAHTQTQTCVSDGLQCGDKMKLCCTLNGLFWKSLCRNTCTILLSSKDRRGGRKIKLL